ncbi:MAG: hypothetical protein H7Y37_11755 [Anaerolineae bacterium]|nr:hypothetical protein [Gloeobacterales cyanobacterium ES-bin-313]
MKWPLRKLVELKLAFESLNSFVQIVAILAAGFWAFYTFVYEDKIKPTAGSPTISIQNTLEKIGSKGNITAIKFVSKIHNTGTMRVRFLAYSLYINGFKVQSKDQAKLNSAKLLAQVSKKGSAEEDRYFSPTAYEVLYRAVILLQGTAKQAKGTIYLDPGMESSVANVFFVDTKRFDEVKASIQYTYTKNQKKEFPMAIQEETRKNSPYSGLVYAQEVNEDPKCTFESFECAVESAGDVSLSLWL